MEFVVHGYDLLVDISDMVLEHVHDCSANRVVLVELGFS
jgi:hypothetical protein